MIKALILFGKPRDADLFDEYFLSKHKPLLEIVPNLDRLVVNQIAGTIKGDSLFRLIAELHFASEEAMLSGLNSEPGQAFARDFGNFATGGVSVLLATSE